VLYFLLPRLGVRITPALAQCLLTGLVTDTLGFRTDGVSAGTFTVAHDLLQAGADLPTIMTAALTSKPLSTLLLWKTGLNNMRLENGLLWTTITNQERLNAGHIGTGSAGLVNLLADAEQAIIGAVLLEYNDGSVYVGFRCRPPYSVSELALNLGGGGHPLASGCNLQLPLADAERLVLEMSKEAIRLQRAEMLEHGKQKHLG
jgi:phosphoesterase RecJ-like protein